MKHRTVKSLMLFVALMMVVQLAACSSYVVNRAAPQKIAKEKNFGVLVMRPEPGQSMLKNTMGALFEQELMNQGLKVKSLRHNDMLLSEMADVLVFEDGANTYTNPYLSGVKSGPVAELLNTVAKNLIEKDKAGLASLANLYGIDYLMTVSVYGPYEMLVEVINLEDYSLAYSYYANGKPHWDRCEMITFSKSILDADNKEGNCGFWTYICTAKLVIEDMRKDVLR